MVVGCEVLCFDVENDVVILVVLLPWEEALDFEDKDLIEVGEVLVSFVNDFAFVVKGGFFEVNSAVRVSVDAFKVDDM